MSIHTPTGLGGTEGFDADVLAMILPPVRNNIHFLQRFVPAILAENKIFTVRKRRYESGTYNAVCKETGEVFAQIRILDPPSWAESDFESPFFRPERFGFESEEEARNYYQGKDYLFVHQFYLLKEGAIE